MISYVFSIIGHVDCEIWADQEISRNDPLIPLSSARSNPFDATWDIARSAHEHASCRGDRRRIDKKRASVFSFGVPEGNRRSQNICPLKRFCRLSWFQPPIGFSLFFGTYRRDRHEKSKEAADHGRWSPHVRTSFVNYPSLPSRVKRWFGVWQAGDFTKAFLLIASNRIVLDHLMGDSKNPEFFSRAISKSFRLFPQSGRLIFSLIFSATPKDQRGWKNSDKASALYNGGR